MGSLVEVWVNFRGGATGGRRDCPHGSPGCPHPQPSPSAKSGWGAFYSLLPLLNRHSPDPPTPPHCNDGDQCDHQTQACLRGAHSSVRGQARQGDKGGGSSLEGTVSDLRPAKQVASRSRRRDRPSEGLTVGRGRCQAPGSPSSPRLCTFAGSLLTPVPPSGLQVNPTCLGKPALVSHRKSERKQGKSHISLDLPFRAHARA